MHARRRTERAAWTATGTTARRLIAALAAAALLAAPMAAVGDGPVGDAAAQATRDIRVQKADSPDPVTEGNELTYTLTVSNLGSQQATSVVVTDDLPATAEFESATTAKAGASCVYVMTTHDVQCNMGTVAAGASHTITIKVTPTAPGEITNSATATLSQTDTNPGNNADTETTTVTAAPYDLGVLKLDSRDPVAVGTGFEYFITVTNFGPSDAEDVTVNDTLPANVAFGGAIVSPSGSCAYDSVTHTVNCDLGDLDDGDDATVTINVTATAAGEAVDTAVANATGEDTNTGNNTDTETTTIVPATADLNVTKTDNPDPVGVDQNLTYTVTVTNDGPEEAENVTLRDVLTGGVVNVVLVEASGNGTCTLLANIGALIQCSFGDMPAGDARIVTIVVRPQQTGTLTNTANATSNTTDPNPANNEAVETTTVTEEPAPEADLSVTKTDTQDPVAAGEAFAYQLQVRNRGPDAAENVTVHDAVPPSFTIQDASASQGPGCTIDGSLVTCPLGTLASGGAATVDIDVRANAAGTYNNSATVTGNASDPTPENNTAEESTTITSDGGPGDGEEPPAAPTNLRCEARDAGNHLDWDASAGATSYHVYRAVEGGGYERVGTTTDTEFLDASVTAGTTYQYKVTAVGAGGESDATAPCEVTAIPLFPAWAFVAVALLGAVGALAWLRRRQA